jgi:hypothetical protein
MKLAEAQQVLREVDGKTYDWLKAWGVSTIREAIRTVEDRVSATDADRELAGNISTKLARRW